MMMRSCVRVLVNTTDSRTASTIRATSGRNETLRHPPRASNQKSPDRARQCRQWAESRQAIGPRRAGPIASHPRGVFPQSCARVVTDGIGRLRAAISAFCSLQAEPLRPDYPASCRAAQVAARSSAKRSIQSAASMVAAARLPVARGCSSSGDHLPEAAPP